MQPCCLPNISTPDSLHPAPPYFSALLFCLFLGISLDPQWGELSEKDRMCQNIPFARCTSCFSESSPELALFLNERKLYKKDKMCCQNIPFAHCTFRASVFSPPDPISVYWHFRATIPIVDCFMIRGKIPLAFWPISWKVTRQKVPTFG